MEVPQVLLRERIMEVPEVLEDELVKQVPRVEYLEARGYERSKRISN